MNEVDVERIKTHARSISPLSETLMQGCQQYINQTFGEGSEPAKKLTPDFALGAKRPAGRLLGDVAAAGSVEVRGECR